MCHAADKVVGRCQFKHEFYKRKVMGANLLAGTVAPAFGPFSARSSSASGLGSQIAHWTLTSSRFQLRASRRLSQFQIRTPPITQRSKLPTEIELAAACELCVLAALREEAAKLISRPGR